MKLDYLIVSGLSALVFWGFVGKLRQDHYKSLKPLKISTYGRALVTHFTIVKNIHLILAIPLYFGAAVKDLNQVLKKTWLGSGCDIVV